MGLLLTTSVSSTASLEKLPYPLENRLMTRVPGKNLDFVVDCALPETPKKFMIYKIIGQRTSPGAPEFAEVSARFGEVLKIGKSEGPKRLVAFAGIDVNNDGLTDLGIDFFAHPKSFHCCVSSDIASTRGKESAYWVDPSSSEEEKLAFAREFLSARGLLPERIDKMSAGADYMLTLTAGQSIPQGVRIELTRGIDGLSVKGTNWIHLVFDNSGKMTNLVHHMPDIVKHREYPIKTPREAIQDLQADVGAGDSYIWTGIRSGTVVVDTVFLVYRTFYPHTKSDYLQPVYVIKGNSHGDFTAYVPAVRREYLEDSMWGRK